MSFQDLLTSHDNNGVSNFNDMVSLGLIPGAYQQLLFGRGTSVNGYVNFKLYSED